MRIVTLFAAVFAASISCFTAAVAAASDGPTRSYREPHIAVTLAADDRAVASGGRLALGVHFALEPGWHIYYREPGAVGLPTAVTWKAPSDWKIAELTWPRPEPFEYDGDKSLGYQGEVLLSAGAEVPAGAAAKSSLTAEVSWLLCKDECIPGSTVLSSTLGEARADSKLLALFDANQAAAPAGAGFSLAALLVAMFGAFIGGMILNLMPCVLPVLSLKILGLVEAQSPRERFIHGLLYSAGVVLSFLLLGGTFLALRALGSQVGWGFQFQSPQFVVGTMFLVFLIGLNLGGIFEIGLSLQSKAGSVETGSGAGGAFWSGVLATALATPCTAPFMGSAIAATMSMPVIAAVAIFVTLGLGMALPYLLLTSFPRLLRFIPKPGLWMEHFRQALSFPMFFTAAWLLWVLGNQSGIDRMAAAACGLVLVGAGAWMFGKWHLPSKPIKVRRRALATSGMCVALALLVGMPHGTLVASASSLEADAAWEPYSAARFAQLKSAGTPVLLDFTAAWCLVCQVNQKRVFENAEVVALLRKQGVVLLKADWTVANPEIEQALAQFGQSGVPLVVLFDRNGKQQEFHSLIDVENFKGAVEKVTKAV